MSANPEPATDAEKIITDHQSFEIAKIVLDLLDQMVGGHNEEGGFSHNQGVVGLMILSHAMALWVDACWPDDTEVWLQRAKDHMDVSFKNTSNSIPGGLTN